MEMTYGFNITSNKDKFLRAAVDALELSNKAVIPGAFLVDTLPIRASRWLRRVTHLTVYNSKVHA